MPTPEMPGLHSSKNWIQTHHSPHSELKPTHQTQIQHHDSSDFTIRHHPVIHLDTFGKITSLKETFKLSKCKMDMGTCWDALKRKQSEQRTEERLFCWKNTKYFESIYF